MEKKIYNLKDEDELVFTGKQLREWKSKIIKESKNKMAKTKKKKKKKKKARIK